MYRLLFVVVGVDCLGVEFDSAFASDRVNWRDEPVMVTVSVTVRLRLRLRVCVVRIQWRV